MNIHTPTDQVLTKCLDLGTLATGDSQSVDCRGYTRAKIVIVGTTAAASTLDATAQESNDNGSSDPFANISGSAIATIPAGQTRLVRTISLNLDKRKRYLRVAETVAGTVTGSLTIELYNAIDYPVVQDSTPVVVN